MTIEQIKNKKSRDAIKFELAATIREILNEAQKKYGESEWVDDEIEQAVQTMVFEEE